MLAEVLTDKATVEVFSPVAGRVTFLRGEVGEVLAVGSDFVGIETDADAPLAPTRRAAGAAGAARRRAARPRPQPAAPQPDGMPSEQVAPPAPPERGAAQHDRASRPHHVAAGQRPIAAPAVRLAAREAGVDLRLVRGSGPAGRITHDDLAAYLAGATAPVGPTPARRRAVRPRSGRSSGCAGGSPTGWRSPRRASRTSPTSTRSTSARSTSCAAR